LSSYSLTAQRVRQEILLGLTVQARFGSIVPLRSRPFCRTLRQTPSGHTAFACCLILHVIIQVHS
jgi:hypothetical protein